MSDLNLAEDLAVAKLSGVVDLRSVEAAFGTVRTAWDEGRGLEIDLAEVSELDLTLVQLVESARVSAAQSGRRVRLSAPAAGAVLEVLTRGGFLSEPADARTKFWLGE